MAYTKQMIALMVATVTLASAFVAVAGTQGVNEQSGNTTAATDGNLHYGTLEFGQRDIYNDDPYEEYTASPSKISLHFRGAALTDLTAEEQSLICEKLTETYHCGFTIRCGHTSGEITADKLVTLDGNDVVKIFCDAHPYSSGVVMSSSATYLEIIFSQPWADP